MSYLKNKIRNLEILRVAAVAAIPSVSYFLGQYNHSLSLFWRIMMGMLMGVMTATLLLMRDKIVESQSNYNKGMMGEEYVEEVLKKLPNNFKYKKSIKNKYGNADFLVIGDNGLFCLEVKNISGKITYNKNDKQLLRNFFPFTKDYIKQVKRNSFEINKFIKQKIDKDVFVIPVLVFSGIGVSLDLEKKIDNVTVLNVNELLNFLVNKEGCRYDSSDLVLMRNINFD